MESQRWISRVAAGDQYADPPAWIERRLSATHTQFETENHSEYPHGRTGSHGRAYRAGPGTQPLASAWSWRRVHDGDIESAICVDADDQAAGRQARHRPA